MSEADVVNEGVELYNSQKFEEAISKYDEALSINPQCKEAYFNKGLCYQSLNDNNKALECFGLALGVDQNYLPAIIGQGNSQLRLGDKEGALGYFDQALGIDPNSALALSGKSICLQQLDNKEEVNEIINKQINENTEDYIPYLLKGNMLKDEQKYEDAIENYQKCLKLNKNCAEAYYNIALCEASLGQNDAALKDIDEAFNLNPELLQAKDAKGCILYSLKNFDEALDCFTQLVEKDSANPDYYFKKGSTERELKKYDDAIKSFDETLKLNPEHTKAMLLKGNCYDATGQKDWALESYENAIQKDSYDGLAHQLKGQNLLSTNGENNNEKALYEFDIQLTNDPTNPEALFLKAFTLSKLGRNDEAIDNYKKSIEANDKSNKDENEKKENDCITNYNIGVLLSKIGQKDEAREHFNKALQSNPNFSKAKVALSMLDKGDNMEDALNELEKENKDDQGIILIKANSLYEKGNYDEALALYQQVNSLSPNNEDALCGIANCLYKMDRKDEALQKYDEVLGLNKENQIALFNKGLLLLENNNYDEGNQLIDAASQYGENPSILIQQGICLLRNENYPEALNKFENALKYDNTNVKAHIGRGQALCGNNQFAESIDAYDKALEFEPSNKNALISKANSYSKTEDFDNAVDFYKQALEAGDENDNCIYLLNYALCLYNQKEELAKAWEVLDKAERAYETQKDKLAPKERQFFDENCDKLKKARESGGDGTIEPAGETES